MIQWEEKEKTFHISIAIRTLEVRIFYDNLEYPHLITYIYHHHELFKFYNFDFGNSRLINNGFALPNNGLRNPFSLSTFEFTGEC